VGIDEATGETVGELQPVTTGIARVMGASISADGQRLAFTVSSTPSEILRYAFDPEKLETVGEPTMVYTSSNALNQLDVSADGEWIAYRTSAPRENIFVMRSDGTGRRRLTDDSFRNRGPRWSPDGKWLVFYTNRSGSYELWIMRPDGTRLRRITDQPGEKAEIYVPLWSHDGKQIAGTRAGLGGVSTVFFTLDGPIEEIDGFLQVEEREIPGFAADVWSPEGGRMMGIAVNELGDYSVAVYSFETDELTMLRTVDGGYLVTQNMEAWLDENRALVWPRQQNKAHVYDARVGEIRELNGVPGPGQLYFADNGRTLFVNRVGDESDVWVLNLSESAED
jgi:dipeptidyl aminopeptidase/acylaminoacyl peptidase